MLCTIRYDQNLSMEMRDGVKLAGEVYRPGGRGKYPAIVMRTPYASDAISGLGSSFIKVIPTVRAGYALVIAHVRGRFGSQGEYNLQTAQPVEGADCYDTIEWVAGQPWCDGNIGMAGESALGTVQWRTARENPPHLKAIAPGLAGAPGKAGPETSDAPVNLNIAVSLLLILAGDVLDRLDAGGADTAGTRRLLAQVHDAPWLAYNYLPLKEVPQFNSPGIRDIWDTCLRMSVSGPTASGQPYPFPEVKIPSLSVTGWYDPFARNSIHSFSKMMTDAVRLPPRASMSEIVSSR